MGPAGSVDVGRGVAGWRTVLLAACASVVACGGRVSIGSLTCSDPDAGQSSDLDAEPACAPPPCPIAGAWQPGGGEFACTNAGCAEVVPACEPGAIRFDSSGALFRLTTAGWESLCAYRTCGNRVTGSQLSNALSDDPLAPGSCGPDWALFVAAGSLDAGLGLATCSLSAYAACAGRPTRSDGPAGVPPWSIEVAYSQCAP